MLSGLLSIAFALVLSVALWALIVLVALAIVG
jgi:hypothetical protein